MRIEKASASEMEAIDDVFEHMNFVPNSMKIMARRPKLIRAFTALVVGTRESCDIDPGLRQMIGHIASTAAGCLYCQAHTSVDFSGGNAIDEKLKVVWEFETHEIFSEAERAALRFARDSSLVPNAVTEQHFEELKQFYSEQEILDMLSWICMYGWLNKWNDTLATPLEEHPISVAEALLSDRGWEVGKHKPG